MQREYGKLERANAKLREEMRSLQEQVTEDMVPKTQLLTYKKEVDIKVGGSGFYCCCCCCCCCC